MVSFCIYLFLLKIKSYCYIILNIPVVVSFICSSYKWQQFEKKLYKYEQCLTFQTSQSPSIQPKFLLRKISSYYLNVLLMGFLCCKDSDDGTAEMSSVFCTAEDFALDTVWLKGNSQLDILLFLSILTSNWQKTPQTE